MNPRLDHPSFISGTLEDSPTLETDLLKLYGLLPIGRVSVTRLADASRQFAAKYTDLQLGLLPGDLVDLYYPITAVLPPNSRTVLSVPSQVRVNLNGQAIGQSVPHDNKVGMLLTFGTGYINGAGAIIYGFGSTGKAIESGDILGGNMLDYRLNSVNVEAAEGAVGVQTRQGGLLTHTGNIKLVGYAIGVRALSGGRYVGQGLLQAAGNSLALHATEAGSITYSGRINLAESSTLQASGAGSTLALEQLVVDGQTNRTVGANLLINAAAGTTLILTEATILGKAGETAIVADKIIYRGRCTIVGNVVANTIEGAPATGGSSSPTTTARATADIRLPYGGSVPVQSQAYLYSSRLPLSVSNSPATGGMVVNSDGTVVVPRTGKYLVTAGGRVNFAAGTTQNTTDILLFKNGSFAPDFLAAGGYGKDSIVITAGSRVMSLAAGDVLAMTIYCETGPATAWTGDNVPHQVPFLSVVELPS